MSSGAGCEGDCQDRRGGRRVNLDPSSAASSHLSRKSSFLAMTFMAKEMTGMREREAAAPPSRGTSILWGDSQV